MTVKILGKTKLIIINYAIHLFFINIFPSQFIVTKTSFGIDFAFKKRMALNRFVNINFKIESTWPWVPLATI